MELVKTILPLRASVKNPVRNKTHFGNTNFSAIVSTSENFNFAKIAFSFLQFVSIKILTFLCNHFQNDSSGLSNDIVYTMLVDFQTQALLE